MKDCLHYKIASSSMITRRDKKDHSIFNSSHVFFPLISNF